MKEFLKYQTCIDIIPSRVAVMYQRTTGGPSTVETSLDLGEAPTKSPLKWGRNQ